MTVSVSAAEWDAFVAAHPEGHILQTSAWADLKCAFGWSAARVGIRDQGELVAGAQVLFRPLPSALYTIAYLPKGPLVDWNNPELVEFVFKSLDNVAQSANAVFLKIEPPSFSALLSVAEQAGRTTNDERRLTMDRRVKVVSAPNIQPRRTMVVDLRPDEEAILAGMKQKTRYNIRLAAKKEVAATPSEDIEAFCQLMQVTGARDQFGVHSDKYYRKAYELFHPAGRAQLFMAMFAGQPLAGLMLFVLGKRAWYFYGGSANEERNRMPAYLLQWEAMRWAKARGVEAYDLWGVPDEEEETLEANFEARQEGLWGVYRFKRGFGGRLVRAPGAVDRVYSPLLYKLYEAYMRRRGRVDS